MTSLNAVTRPVSVSACCAAALGQEQVAVGMDAATEAEVRAGEEAQVDFREHPELEHRNRHRLHGAAQVHFAAGRGLGGDVDLIGRLERRHPRRRRCRR